jgi:hypothetical protein
MAFVMTLAFATEHDRESFRDKILPRLRATEVDPEGDPGDPPGLYRIGVAVTSHSAARDVCHQLNAFLVKAQNDIVNVYWTGVEGTRQSGEARGNAPREAEVLSVRIGAAAKARLDEERAKAAQVG